MFNKKKNLIESLQLQVTELNSKVDTLSKELEDRDTKISQKLIEIDDRDKKIKDVTKQLTDLQAIVSNEQLEADKILKLLEVKTRELQVIEEEIEGNKNKIKEQKEKIVKNEDRLNIQSFGFYEPIYKDKCSEDLKEEIASIREKEKDMIRNEYYYVCPVNWTVNDSESKGTKLVSKMAKNYITSFNLMCDAIIDRVTVANIVKTKEKISKTFENINKQLEFYQITYSERYLELKINELELMYSLALKIQDEKEEKRVQAELIKEQKKVEKELQKQREKLEKELQHYQKQLDNGDNKVIEKIQEIEQQIADNDYRKNNAMAGYVYIIENKSFGEEVYKIGVTRRLEPLDRIAELSNASVPFRFQVNCIIFSENAFKLESDLHKEFAQYRVNKVNMRKEYFKLPLLEIEKVVKEKYIPDAEFILQVVSEEWQVSSQSPEINGVDDEDDED